MKDNDRVAIMTWYTYKNYGSVLQASALYHVVEKMQYKPDFIKYIPKGNIEEHTKIKILKRVYNKYKYVCNYPYESEERDILFSEYLKNRATFSKYCVSYSELNDLNNEYSAFICGSDQIWSPLCYDSKYFLDFVDDTDKMIAYAPSIGSERIDNPIIRSKISSNISRFKNLSVREQRGAEIIKNLTGQDAKVVLDPTLLMNAEEWDSYIDGESIHKMVDKKYILCYFLGESEKYMGYVRTVSKALKIPFYIIPVTKRQKKCGNEIPFEVGPREFVSLIKNADYVCTDSFHGMAFSVNYNVPFSVFKRFRNNDSKNQNSRIISLLNLLHLEDRLVDYNKKNDIQVKMTCDFSKANTSLTELRNKSINYLENALTKAVDYKGKKVNTINNYKITNICCGCGACVTACRMGAITISKDGDGFEHYFIDFDKCVKCGQCKKVCPMTNIDAMYIENAQRLWAIKSKSLQVLKKSSSGGVGYEIASFLLDNDYAVCGCMYDISDNSAKHIWVMPDEKEKLACLQGSKYIQSISSEAIKQMLEIIKIKKIVFFGTPCQAAAVDKVLKKNGLRKDAVIVDLICHGVPSYHLWRKYIDDINKKYDTGVHPDVLFRNKELEWRNRQVVISGKKNIYKNEECKDDFYAFFRRGLCDMEACTDCPYRERSAADIRIGDYWGNRFITDKQGVSMVIANTSYGNDIITFLKENSICDAENYDLKEYWTVQYPYNHKIPLVREQLITELKIDNSDLSRLRKKYCKYYDWSEKAGRIVNTIRVIVKGRKL